MAARKKPKKRTTKAKSTRKSKPYGLRLAQLAPSLTVDDVTRSLKWYVDILGFKVTHRWERDGRLHGVELEAGDVVVYLSQEDGGKGPRIKGQGLRLYWYTKDNIDQIAARIKARGGHLASEPKDEWGVRSFNLVDPTGFLITISSEPS